MVFFGGTETWNSVRLPRTSPADLSMLSIPGEARHPPLV